MDTKYSVSFARRALLYNESVLLAKLYLAEGNWVGVRKQVLENNLLQARKVASLKTLCTELVARLKNLSVDELAVVVDGTREEQGYMLWIAVCKRYAFLFELGVEVVREKYLHLDFQLTIEDYDRFFSAKAEWHDELAGLSMESQRKIRQTAIQLLRECGLINRQNVIVPAVLSSHFIEVVYKNSRKYLSALPISDIDIRVFAK